MCHDEIVDDYERAVHEELEHRLDAQTINDLSWYFFHCRSRTDWREYKAFGSDIVKERFARCAQACADAGRRDALVRERAPV